MHTRIYQVHPQGRVHPSRSITFFFHLKIRFYFFYKKNELETYVNGELSMCIEATKPEQKSPKSVQKFTSEIRTQEIQKPDIESTKP